MKLADIVERFGGSFEGNPELEIEGVSGVEFAGPDEATRGWRRR